MNSLISSKDMKLTDFEFLLNRLKKSGSKIVKILGGEPTLHKNLDKIILQSLKSFDTVQVFTNGIFSDSKAKEISDNFPKVQITFNVMTPGFLFNKRLRETVIQRIKDFSNKTRVTLSLTIDPYTDLGYISKLMPKSVIKNVYNFRIGFSNPTAGEKNYYQFSDFPRMGRKLTQLVKIIKNRAPQSKMSLNCGFTRCMFTNQQYDYVSKNVNIRGWGCFGKSGSMDVTTDLEAFHCFPLSTKDRFDAKKDSIKKIDAKLILKRYEYWKKIQLEICVKCPFYGHSFDKCPGPCIAFRMNN